MTPLQKKYSFMLLVVLSVLLVVQTGIMTYRYTAETWGTGRFGGDFLGFWQAAHHVRAGNIAAIYDAESWKAVLTTTKPKLLAWFVYPPFTLFGLWPLGRLTYNEAVLVWSLLPLPVYFGLNYMLLRRSLVASRADVQTVRQSTPVIFAVLSAFAMPFLAANLLTGQTGTLIATLFLGAAYCWRGHPILAGVLIGLLAVKPQMALLIPLALLASARWSTIAATVATITTLAVAATLWLGPAIWAEYLAMARVFSTFIGQGYSGIHQLALAPYVSLVSVGVPAFAAAILHGGCLLVVAGIVFSVFRSYGLGLDDRDDLRLSLLAAGSLLATPYALSYDMPLLMLSVVPFVVRAWFRSCTLAEFVALAALLFGPYVQPLAVVWHIPFGFIALSLWFYVLYLRTVERSAVPPTTLAHKTF
jgi:alpha-1,2-mannosyltransferase